MKLLSFTYENHDSSISYYDGKKVSYLKVERLFQFKHYKVKDKSQIENIIKEKWNITFNDIDKICIPIFHRGSSFIFKELINSNITEIDHHYAHAQSISFFCAEQPNVSIIIDGQGGTNCWVILKNQKLIEQGIVDLFGSIGHGIQYLCKELNISGGLDAPGKLMGLQSYGRVDSEYLIKLQAFDIYSVGAYSHKIPNEDNINFYGGNKLFSIDKWVEHKGAKIDLLDWAKTIHTRCGEIILELFKKHAKPDDIIHYSGGVAQNVIWNTLLKKHFKNLIILPHVGDEGTTLGGLEYLRIKHTLPRFKLKNFPFCQTDESTDNVTDDTIKQTARFLADGKIVAWYQGNGEIGPRALGNRSILMDPRIENGKDIINKIKNREHYRPFGASILEEYKKEYFDLDFENPYMLYVGVTQKDNLKAITHVDGTCRVQTVKEGSFRKLLEYFYEYTGCPVLLNTSLNVSGKPIAGYISNAEEEFNSKDIDVLVVGNKISIK